MGGRQLNHVMVTGANGFVGRHVVAGLASRGCAVIAVSRQDEADPEIAGLVKAYLACDLADLDETRTLPFEGVGAVINLAGLAAVGESFSQRELYMRVNAGVIDTVCQVALERDLDVRVIAVSSGAVYAGRQDMPLSEGSAVDACSSPYAESKLAMEDRAQYYRDAGVDCVIVRPFNHIGPGQGLGFLVPDLFAQIQQAVATGGPMLIGNLSTRRDYTDVRDVARSYVALASAGSLEHDVYNVCTGRSLPGAAILAIMLAQLGLSELEVREDPSRFRPSDQPDICGKNARLTAAVGWGPSITIERSIADFVAAARDAGREGVS